MSDRELDKASADAKDAVHEVTHRTVAEAEHLKRDVAGDAMTPGEKLRSGANEAKHRIEAEVDKTKRDVRDKT